MVVPASEPPSSPAIDGFPTSPAAGGTAEGTDTETEIGEMDVEPVKRLRGHKRKQVGTAGGTET